MAGKISLLLADVDGTLVTKEKTLTERTIAAIRALRAQGTRFAITSGRPPRGMKMLIEPLDIDTPIAGFNGGLLVDRELNILDSRNLDRAAAERTVDAMRAHGLDVWVYAGEDWLVPKADGPHVAREEWTVKFPPTVASDFGAALDRAVKIVGVSDDRAVMERAAREISEMLGDDASAATSQPYYLDVTNPRAHKGEVVATLSERLGIPTDEIATFGDQPNDIHMFRRSGVSIAMGQASDEVKRAATHVTEDSESEGFAIGIERFLLGHGA